MSHSSDLLPECHIFSESYGYSFQTLYYIFPKCFSSLNCTRLCINLNKCKWKYKYNFVQGHLPSHRFQRIWKHIQIIFLREIREIHTTQTNKKSSTNTNIIVSGRPPSHRCQRIRQHRPTFELPTPCSSSTCSLFVLFLNV